MPQLRVRKPSFQQYLFQKKLFPLSEQLGVPKPKDQKISIKNKPCVLFTQGLQINPLMPLGVAYLNLVNRWGKAYGPRAREDNDPL